MLILDLFNTKYDYVKCFVLIKCSAHELINAIAVTIPNLIIHPIIKKLLFG